MGQDSEIPCDTMGFSIRGSGRPWIVPAELI